MTELPDKTDYALTNDADAASARNRRGVSTAPVAVPATPIAPRLEARRGRYGAVTPLDPARHADALFTAAYDNGSRERVWAYTLAGPFESLDTMRPWLDACAAKDDPMMFTIVEAADQAPTGMAAIMNIRPGFGVAEIGHIWLGTKHQRNRASTEALILLMRHVLDDCRYRRLEWKCNAGNMASRRAALRLGFRFEGVFLNHMTVKGRNRDTAWYSLLDSEWPAVRANLDRWLDPANFDEDGHQRTSLSALNRALW